MYLFYNKHNKNRSFRNVNHKFINLNTKSNPTVTVGSLNISSNVHKSFRNYKFYKNASFYRNSLYSFFSNFLRLPTVVFSFNKHKSNLIKLSKFVRSFSISDVKKHSFFFISFLDKLRFFFSYLKKNKTLFFYKNRFNIRHNNLSSFYFYSKFVFQNVNK